MSCAPGRVTPSRLSGPLGKQQICSAVAGNLCTVCLIGNPAKKILPPFLEVQMQVALSSDGTNSQALQMEVQLLLCPFASTALLGHGGWLALWLARRYCLWGRLSRRSRGRFGRCRASGFLHSGPHRDCHVILSGLSCRSLSGELCLVTQGCRHQRSWGFRVAGTADVAMTALLMRQTPAPCFPPQARPDCCS